ncbi:MAG: response regulator [Chitinophagaceae bacterium]|nr:response regulator [Chitinophagaceae bacterium]
MDTKKKLQCVLLIDDDEVTNFLNRRVIEYSKIAEHVEVKLNGQEALDFLTDKQTTDNSLLPCLILLDINMPVMDGWEFMQEYTKEALDQKKNMNIVMLSTSTNPDDIKRAASLPFVKAFKSKPLTSEVLEEILTNYF